MRTGQLLRSGKQSHLAALAVSFLATGTVFATQLSNDTMQTASFRNTPKFVSTARNLGPENPSATIDVSIWLNPHNRAAMDSLARELYSPNSTNYHRWLARADFASKFAPSAQEAKVIEDFFSSHNLRVVMVGPHNLFVRAQGTVSDVSKAFHVQIDKFEVNGKIFRSNTSDPSVDGSAAALTRAVSGLDDLRFAHPVVTRPTHIGTGATTASTVESATAAADPAFFTSHCFTGPKTERFSTDGTFPTATYTGNGYFSPPTEPGCGYTPPEIHTAYHLNGLYREGFDGTGQTIVIIDFCGSPSILQDANAFSARFGLPPLNPSNFHITKLFSPRCAAPDAEINLDVEWAHAIAPGANIELLIAGEGFVSQADEAELYAVLNGLGNVISGSFGLPEVFLPTAEIETEDLINEIAALFGVGANFSSGDAGDFTYETDGFSSVSAPADSQFATAVGGVSLALNNDNSIKFQTGWGNNETLLIEAGTIFDYPLNFGNIGGSGGGPSSVIPKPSFQARLPGTFRQLPDVSWLADPFTGGVFLITFPGVFPPQLWEVIGGTSLACPMFSALWAIANQEAGVPLGQAAPYLYSMPKGTITDVLPITSPTNVTATIHETSTQTNHFSAAELAEPLEGSTKFYSFLWDYPFLADTTLVITLGTDTGLRIKPGWDNVTGLGTPNGQTFADHFNPAR